MRDSKAHRWGSFGLLLASLVAVLVVAVRPSVTPLVIAAALWWATSLALLWWSYQSVPASPTGTPRAPITTRPWWRDLFLRPHSPRDLQRTSFLAFLLCSGFLCAVVLALLVP
jgi:cobalamin synthase